MKISTVNAKRVLIASWEAARSSLRGWPLTSMRIASTYSLAVVTSFLLFLLPSRSNAQDLARLEVGADYNFVHTNAPPGECGCFSMQGGDAWLGWHFTDHLSLVGQAAVQHASNINDTTANLTLISFLAGPRINFRSRHRIAPFAQGLFGVAHASGLLTPSATTGLSASANVFAAVVGGGVDFDLTGHLGLRAIEADYYFTRFQNGTNNRQNNFKISAGIFWRFGRRR